MGWVELSINLLLTKASWKITVPFNILSGFAAIKESDLLYSKPWLEVFLEEEVTERIVCIQDKNMYVTGNANNYVPVISDMCKMVGTEFNFHNPSPYIPTKSSQGPIKQLATTNFFNPQATMNEGLHNYLANMGGNINKYTVPDLDEIKWQ